MAQPQVVARIGFVLMVFGCLTLSMPVRAEDTKGSSSAHGTHWEWTPDAWSLTTEYRDIHDWAPRPDEKMLRSVLVEWRPPERDFLGNLCKVRGRLVIPDTEPGQNLPVRWFQGVTVYMAMAPDSKPDWSEGMKQGETHQETELIESSGEFEVRLDLKKVDDDRSAKHSFQFGLALAEHVELKSDRQKVVWTSRLPAIPTSVQMLDVPAAPGLSPELDLINRARDWPFSNHNGVALIRAVNALQRVGKDEALANLERFVELTEDAKGFDEQDIVFWIIRVLFEPIRLDDRLRSPAIAVHLDDRGLPDAAKWPLNPIAIVGDIPLILGQRIGSSGMPEHPSSHLEWARRHGVIRDEPLRPTMDPWDAVEMIMRSHRFQRLDEYSLDRARLQLKEQATAMLKNIVEVIPADGDNVEERKDLPQIRGKDDHHRKIVWDADREEFVAKEK